MGQLSTRHVTEKATLKREQMSTSLVTITQQFIGWSKWLNASLFAINGAGVLAISSNLKELGLSPNAAIPFCVGIILALFSGALMQEYYQRSIPFIAKKLEYWTKVENGQPRNIRFENKLQSLYNNLDRLAWLPPACGWSSGVAFIVGLINFSINLT